MAFGYLTETFDGPDLGPGWTNETVGPAVTSVAGSWSASLLDAGGVAMLRTPLLEGNFIGGQLEFRVQLPDRPADPTGFPETNATRLQVQVSTGSTRAATVLFYSYGGHTATNLGYIVGVYVGSLNPNAEPYTYRAFFHDSAKSNFLIVNDVNGTRFSRGPGGGAYELLYNFPHVTPAPAPADHCYVGAWATRSATAFGVPVPAGTISYAVDDLAFRYNSVPLPLTPVSRPAGATWSAAGGVQRDAGARWNNQRSDIVGYLASSNARFSPVSR